MSDDSLVPNSRNSNQPQGVPEYPPVPNSALPPTLAEFDVRIEAPDPFEDSTPIPKNVPREYIGWLAISIFFIYYILSGLLGERGLPVVNNDLSATKSSLKLALSYGNTKSPFNSTKESRTEELHKAQTELGKAKPSDLESKLLLIQVNYELGKRPSSADLQPFARSLDLQQRAFSRLYGPKVLSRVEVERALATWKKSDVSTMLARVHALERLGDNSVRSTVFSRRSTIVLILFVLVAFGLFGAGIIAWFVYFYLRSNGTVRPLGLPNWPMRIELADRYVLRAALLFVSFVIFSLIAAAIYSATRISKDLVQILPGIGMILIALNLPKDKFFGNRLTTRGIGVNSNKLDKRFLWGTTGFLANIPLLALVVIVTLPLTRLLPTHPHPAGEEMMSNPSLPAILSVLFMASIVAPIWEEIAFRGLLFPAFAKVTNNVVLGAIISSFLFAAIHPQGPGGWPALFTIAMMNCALTYHTKSVVPGIVLHFIHNTFTMIMALVLSQYL